MKPKQGYPKLSVGRDIKLTNIPSYLNFALVARFWGKVTGKVALTYWMDKNWNPILGYTPKFHILPKGCFLFNIKKEDDNTLLLS